MFYSAKQNINKILFRINETLQNIIPFARLIGRCFSKFWNSIRDYYFLVPKGWFKKGLFHASNIKFI